MKNLNVLQIGLKSVINCVDTKRISGTHILIESHNDFYRFVATTRCVLAIVEFNKSELKDNDPFLLSLKEDDHVFIYYKTAKQYISMATKLLNDTQIHFIDRKKANFDFPRYEAISSQQVEKNEELGLFNPTFLTQCLKTFEVLGLKCHANIPSIKDVCKFTGYIKDDNKLIKSAVTYFTSIVL